MLNRSVLRNALLKRGSALKFSTSTEISPSIQTLSNGVKVITSPVPCHFSAVTCTIQAGSRYENDLTMGSTHLLDWLSFKSTEKYSQQEMEEGLLSLGGSYNCTTTREAVVYSGSTFQKDFEQLVDYISQTVKHPRLDTTEVAEKVSDVKYELGEIWQRSDDIIPELSARTSFKNQLGNPLLCPEERLSLITPSQLWQYRFQLFRPERMTLAFTGVTPDRAFELAQKYWGHLSSDNAGLEPPQKTRSTYAGGEIAIPMAKQIGNIPVFEHLSVTYRGVPGIEHPNFYALFVLQKLLGGGSSFSAGGPGKGMFSRLYTEVLNKYGFVESAMGVMVPFSDDSLFGIHTSVIPGAAKYAAYVVGSQLALLMTPGQLSHQEVERAKSQLSSHIVMNLESQMTMVEEMGQQMALINKLIPLEHHLEQIRKLTVEDLQRTAQEVLTGSEATLVMQGEREEFGDVEKVLKEFGLGVSA